ncbi:MAG TPA: tetratricopeptide repeat protein [Chitinophagaceae bacterium]|nr:tetratricopeptide repeat protein [Chitinophagaceae bacterium]
MKKISLSLVAFIMSISFAFAQDIGQGRKFFYYERYKSAKETFEKILASNPNNIEAIYWLGQTLIEQKDSAAAKALYQRAMTTNSNPPLLLVGMGHIELMEGKTNDARQRFETALSLTKSKDIQVFNAIGRANALTRLGDANYAIEKLTQATQLKGFNDPYTYLIMGDAYRKNIDGGGAVTAYNKALALDPKLAAAKYRIGKVYLTQNNKEFFLPAFEQAIQIDPAYTPALYELFYYWYFRDVNKAEEYLNQYVANFDQGPEIEYLRTDFRYAKGDFAGAKIRAQELINQMGDKVNPRMFRMLAYTSDTLGDPAAAKQAMNVFLSKADSTMVLPADFIELANINAKIAGSEKEAFKNFETAIAMDTLVENKVKYINQAAALAKKLGDRNQQAIWLGVAYRIDPKPTQTDLYNYGMAHYQAGNYDSSVAIFCDQYQTKYPNEIFGYLWCAKSWLAKDTTMATGNAVAAYELLAQKAMEIDSVKYKSQAINAWFLLTTHANDIKKDPRLALTYIEKILQADPGNQYAPGIKNILERAINRPARQESKPAAKPNTRSSSGGGGTRR